MAENRGNGGAKSGLDISTPLGLVVGFGFLLFSFIAEEGFNPLAPMAFFGGGGGLPTGFMIVFGGTFGAILIAFPRQIVFSLPKLLMLAFRDRKENHAATVGKFVHLADKMRRDGLLSLEEEANNEEDPFLKKSLLLVVDAVPVDVVRSVMEFEIAQTEARHKVRYKMLGEAGAFAPTMGIIGTVMSLVSVLGKLSDPSTDLGHAIATAFIATLWGVMTANLFWLPMSSKLKEKSEGELEGMRLMVEGVYAVGAGQPSTVVEQLLMGFLSKDEQAHAKAEPEAVPATA